MPQSVEQSASLRHLSRLESLHPSMAKADLKNLEMQWRQRIGKAIERCFKLADVTQKEGAALVDRDQGQIGRWITGAEPQQLHAILAVPTLRPYLIVALAELDQEHIEVETVIRHRRIA